ncbi:putative lipoprotein [Plesiocystis pacifica SIR-1]|uniref:Putative lipoprotein n=1 Tax=Plesiocystis pacifica SIR-1 TaxID=391625 RepID=A6G6W7_9BACT|nr:DUF4215 domain-containing protein [Plesiocystis pacifica]EDM78420.1 putative lipoprotein [Plesiocystis pacifica SIR-1]
MSSHIRLSSVAATALVSLTACSSSGGDINQVQESITTFETAATVDDGNDEIDGDTMGGEEETLDEGTDSSESGGVPPNCGDGILTTDEACDDGNTEDGDGCSADCLTVDPGYQCQPPGEPCQMVVICGDGLVQLPELCDDGNTEDGDGCSAFCKVEIGWDCQGEPTSTCEETVCGDGIMEGAESCDDGNAIPLDGCDDQCQQEPNCPPMGACSSECGDGLVLGEECDDGNTLDGDGCSAECTVEDGFVCGQEECEMINGECILRVNSVYRDFSSNHPDFETSQAYGCVTDGSPPVNAQTKATFDMVAPTLDADIKPQWAAGNCASQSNFDQWYRDVPGVNTTVSSTIPLFPNGEGGFVNRFGPNGETWVALTNVQWAANTLAECEAMGCVPCPWDANVGCWADEVHYDGTPLFFPIDDIGGQFSPARIPEQYGYPGWPWESEVLGNNVQHNFHFTSEITYWFIYDEDVPATLDFTGDDDVWVFVNGSLVVDLGGIHVPIDGSVTVDAQLAGTLGLVDGEAYRVNVFHAERKTEGSSFRLTLSGFDTSRSECIPICGDGVVSLGEQCDDGVNDGGYGECGEGCMLDEYCGDGIVQEEFEDCDDGNFYNDDECPSSCIIVVIP